MPRFKQPLQGLSRLSDRVGGGSAIQLIDVITSGGSSFTTSSIVKAGDLIVLLSSTVGATVPTLPTGFTNYTTVENPSGNGKIRVSYKLAVGGAETVSGVTNSGWLSVLVLRGSAGLGVNATLINSVSGTSVAVPSLPTLTDGSWVIVANSRDFSAFAPLDSDALFITNTAYPHLASMRSMSPAFSGGTITQASAPRVAISLEVLAA